MATKIKGRGNSSWKWEKKPYALKLSSKTEVLGMPRHKRWCLIANYMDRTLMRNRVAHYIASHTSLRWTPRTRYADVYFNGIFLGNYLVVEQIKIDPNRLDIDELSPADTEGDALTGGYLLEMDSYFDEVYKFRSTYSDMPVNVKSPDETIAPEQGRYIQNYFNAADNLLFDKDYGRSAQGDLLDTFGVARCADSQLVTSLYAMRRADLPRWSALLLSSERCRRRDDCICRRKCCGFHKIYVSLFDFS